MRFFSRRADFLQRMAKSMRWCRRLRMITESVFSFSSQLFTTAAHMFMSCVSPIALGSATFHCRVAHVLTSASHKWIGPDRCSKLKGLLALTLPMFANWKGFWCGTCLLIPMPIILCTHKKYIIIINIFAQRVKMSPGPNANGTKRPGSQTMWSSPAKAMIDGTLRSYKYLCMGWVVTQGASKWCMCHVSKKSRIGKPM